MRHPQLSADQLRRLRDRLLAERAELRRRVRRIDDLGLGRSLGEALGELSTYDNHPADIGDELFERSKDLGLKTRFRQRLHDVDQALGLMRRGMYGLCVDCGRPIPPARLEAQPAALRCTACQRRIDDVEGFTRPSEEEVLQRSWRRLFGDGAGRLAADDSAAYDGEDAWQEVERYGTSSPPADRRSLGAAGDDQDDEGGGGAGEG